MAISIGDSFRKSLLNRQAKPLNGEEIKRALESQVTSMTNLLLQDQNLEPTLSAQLLDSLLKSLRRTLTSQNRLKIHISYPKAGWRTIIRLEESDDKDLFLSGETDLDLERNVRIALRYGKSGQGIVRATLEEEKLPTAIPDRDRDRFNLPITLDYSDPDGNIHKTDLSDLRKEKIAARTVEVGRGSEGSRTIDLPDPQDLTKTIKVPVGNAVEGQKIEVIQPDDLIATPPIAPKDPSSIADPNLLSPLSKKSVPNVKLKK